MDGPLACCTNTPYRTSHHLLRESRRESSLQLAASELQCSIHFGQTCVTASLIALLNIDLSLCSSTRRKCARTRAHTHIQTQQQRAGHKLKPDIIHHLLARFVNPQHQTSASSIKWSVLEAPGQMCGACGYSAQASRPVFDISCDPRNMRGLSDELELWRLMLTFPA